GLPIRARSPLYAFRDSASAASDTRVWSIRRRRPRVPGSIPKSEPANLFGASPSGPEPTNPQPSISWPSHWSVTEPHAATRRCRPSRLRRMRGSLLSFACCPPSLGVKCPGTRLLGADNSQLARRVPNRLGFVWVTQLRSPSERGDTPENPAYCGVYHRAALR